MPQLGNGKFQYDPTGTIWTFAGNSGIAANQSGFTAANPNSPQGTQVGFLQGTGSFSQVTSLPAGTYQISLLAAQRVNNHQNFQVLVDGNVVGSITPAGSSYAAYTTSTFTLTAGNHTVAFKGVDSAGGDNTAFIDAVTLTLPPPPIANASFEAPALGNGFKYDPTGAGWTFTGNSGEAGNGSGFTFANPNAPQGTQVAFLQGTGSFTQAIAGWFAGTYEISFQAVQRLNNHQNFQVLVDGNVVDSVTPVGSSYAGYLTSAFTVTAGTHTVTFKGVDSAGGDNTAFVDAVSVMASAVGVDIEGQPANTVLGQAIPPSVTVFIVDQGGNLFTGSDAPVTISIYSGPKGAKLTGQTTVNAVNGVAEFTGLMLNEVGSYQLKVTGPGLTPDISNVFTVMPKPR